MFADALQTADFKMDTAFVLMPAAKFRVYSVGPVMDTGKHAGVHSRRKITVLRFASGLVMNRR